MSSYYGSIPGTPRSITPSSAATSSTPISSPSETPRSMRSLTPNSEYDLSQAKYPLSPPTPLKAAHTRRTPTPALRVQPPQGKPLGTSTPIRTDSPSPSPLRNAPSPHTVRTPSPLSERTGASPYSGGSNSIASPLSSRHSPSPVLNPGEYKRSPGTRALSPLPEVFEIAIPPGVQLRPNTPTKQFHNQPYRSSSHYSLRSESQQSHHQHAYTPTINQGTTPWPSATPYAGSPVPPIDRCITPAELKAMSALAPKASTPYELNGLWNAAHGATCDGSNYVLNMFRQPPPTTILSCPEHFTFGPSMSQPFYTLRALPLSALSETFNELSLTRQNPLLASSSAISLLNMTLNPTCTPDQNGLITHIYPKRAVYALSPHPDKTAIAVAAETECCKLIYNTSKDRYELHHPQMQSFGGDASLVLKIEGGRVGFGTLGARGAIKLVNVVNQETLAALDFGKAILWINTAATRKLPTKHAVDVVVAAILAVGVVEGRKESGEVPTSSAVSNGGRKSVSSKRRDQRRHPNGGEKRGREEMGPTVKRNGVVTVFRGIYFVAWFTVKLPWEIVKAILEAFRSDPPREKEKRRRRHDGKDGTVHDGRAESRRR